MNVMLARPPRRPGPRVAHVSDVADLAGLEREREVVREAAAPQARATSTPFGCCLYAVNIKTLLVYARARLDQGRAIYMLRNSYVLLNAQRQRRPDVAAVSGSANGAAAGTLLFVPSRRRDAHVADDM